MGNIGINGRDQFWNAGEYAAKQLLSRNVTEESFNPDFPLARLWSVIGGEFDRQIELRSLIPQTLHPLALLHRYCQIEYGFSAVGGGVGRLGK